MKQCEGYRRQGGDPMKWVQCENKAIVQLTFIQEGEKEILPACIECWQEAVESIYIGIIEATLIGEIE